MSFVNRVTDGLEKPEQDKRLYRVVILENRMEVLLIQDPNTDKASASLCVEVGGFSDDPTMEGLAHAVEHALSMGTEKYPGETAYSEYLATHSGYHNAQTCETETTYGFEVAGTGEVETANGAVNMSAQTQSPLYGALDRFAQFFIKPLFSHTTLDRELQAVDAEHKFHLQDDSWRLRQLYKSLSNPNHPYHRFITGTLQTLRDDPQSRGIEVRSKFIDFFKKHYSANLMKLVVLGRESLDQLENWVVELFSGVQNKNLAQNRWDDVQPFLYEQLRIQVFARPVTNSDSVSISFPFLDEEGLFMNIPSQYISHLIGHKGPGSILSYIKTKGWANELVAGVMPVCPGSAFFNISITLTKDGLAYYRKVIKVVFQYIAMIKERAPELWIFDEIRTLAEVNFKFKQKLPAFQSTNELSRIMQKPLPRKWLLNGYSIPREFDADLITKALSYLRSDNFTLMIVSQDLPNKCDMTEKWYGTEYEKENIPPNFLKEIADTLTMSSTEKIQDLYLPQKNNFIPTRLTVGKEETAQSTNEPELIYFDSQIRHWHKKDNRFCVPKATIHIILRNPLVCATPANHVKAELYCELIKDALAKDSWNAELAGIYYSLSPSSLGLHISVGGYNEKLPVLLGMVVSKMCDLVVYPERFTVVKEQLARDYQNAEFRQPYKQVMDFMWYLITDRAWINEQFAAELEQIEAADVTAFFPQLLQQNHIELLTHGNLWKEDALQIRNIVDSNLRGRPLPQSQWHVRRNILLPSGSNYVYMRQLNDPQNVNNCIEYLLFVGERADNILRAKLLLLAQMTKVPAFDQLRTKEQLGYAIWSEPRYFATTIGYHVIIQSKHNSQHLETRIDSFLKSFAQTLENMSEEEFESHKQSVINERLQKIESLESETTLFWIHIHWEDFNFSEHEIDAVYVKRMTKADLLAFYREKIDPASETRAKISIHLNAQSVAGVSHAMVNDVPKFKAQFPLSPGPSSVVRFK